MFSGVIPPVIEIAILSGCLKMRTQIDFIDIGFTELCAELRTVTIKDDIGIVIIRSRKGIGIKIGLNGVSAPNAGLARARDGAQRFMQPRRATFRVLVSDPPRTGPPSV